MKKHKIFKSFLFLILSIGCTGTLWLFSSSCGGGVRGENPTNSELGAVNIALNFKFRTDNDLQTMQPLFSGAAGGACFNKTVFFDGAANILCKKGPMSPSWTLTDDIKNMNTNDIFLDIQISGSSSFFAQYTFKEADIKKDNLGRCFVTVAAPKDQNSTVSIRLIDVCCTATAAPRRLEWKSSTSDPFTTLSANIPVTQTQVNAGTTIPTYSLDIAFSSTIPCR